MKIERESFYCCGPNPKQMDNRADINRLFTYTSLVQRSTLSLEKAFCLLMLRSLFIS